MLVDCDVCRVRGPACGDCVVTVLLGAPPHGVHLDPEERAALDVLAASGLVPPLRLVVLGPPLDPLLNTDDDDGRWDPSWDDPAWDEPALEPGVVVARRRDRGDRAHRHVG